MTSNSRQVPYGWKFDDAGKRIRDEAQQRVIKEIQKQALECMSLSMIADGLNKRRAPTQRGGLWRANTVQNILTANPPKRVAQNSTQAAPNQLLGQIKEDHAKDGFVWVTHSINPDTAQTKEQEHWITPADWE